MRVIDVRFRGQRFHLHNLDRPGGRCSVGSHTNTATKRRHATAPHFTTSHVSVLFTATDSAVALVIDGGVGTKSSAEANRNET